MDSALQERYPHVVPATFRGREALVVLGPHKIGITYLRWLFGQEVSMEEALADEHLRAQVYRGDRGELHLNPAHQPRTTKDAAPRFLVLVRSHNGTGAWKRRLVPGSEINLSPAVAPDRTGEFPVGSYPDLDDKALTG